MTRAGRILLIEDQPAAARLTLEAIRETAIAKELTTLHNGQEVTEFFGRLGRFAKTRRPELILLDLHLPGKDGLEILADLKKDPLLCTIPVIVLTTSAATSEVRDAYGLHANGYIVKPQSYDRLLATCQAIGEFWFGVATLPPESP